MPDLVQVLVRNSISKFLLEKLWRNGDDSEALRKGRQGGMEKGDGAKGAHPHPVGVFMHLHEFVESGCSLHVDWAGARGNGFLGID